MRKYVTMLIGLVVVVTVVCLTGVSQNKAEAGITDLLPENTQVLIKFGAFETLRQNLALTDTTVFGQPIQGIEGMKADLGFNPFNLAELKAHGFDPSKESGLAVTDIVVANPQAGGTAPNFNGLLLLPVTDGPKALQTIAAALQKGKTKMTQAGNVTVVTGAGPHDKFYLAVKDTYLLLAANPAVDAKPFIEAVLGGKSSLAKAKAYTAVASKVNAAKDIFAYVNIAQFAAKNLAAIKNLAQQATAAKGGPDVSAWVNYLSDYEGAGLSVDAGTPNLMVQSVLNLAAGAKSLKAWQGVQPNKNTVLGIPQNPVLLFSVLLNAAEYYKLLKGAMPEVQANNFKTQLESIKTTFGIDLENEVIQNLGGNLNLGVYDGMSLTMMNFNTLLTVSVKDEAVLKGVIAKVLAQTPPPQKNTISKQTVGGVEANVVMAGPVQVYAGVKNKNLIVTLGPALFEKAVQGDVATGFASKLADQELAAKIKGGESLFYLNVDEALKAVKNFEMFFPQGKGLEPQVLEAAGKFEYALASSKLEDAAVLSNFTVKTKFTEPFFVAVAKLAQSFAPAPQPQKSQKPQKPPQSQKLQKPQKPPKPQQ